MNRKFTLLFVVFTFCCALLKAQNDKPLRVEIEAKSGVDAHVIIPFSDKGVVLIYQGDESIDKISKKWYVSLYDVNFAEKWTKEYAVLKELSFKYFDYSNKNIYIYLENANYSGSKGNFQILKIDVTNASVDSYKGFIPVNCVVTGFKVQGDIAMLTGRTTPSRFTNCMQSCIAMSIVPLFFNANIIRYQPFMYLVDLQSKSEKQINIPFKGQAYIENIDADSLSNNFVLSLKNHIPRKTNTLYVLEYSSGGVKTNSLSLQPMSDKRKLNTAKVISLSGEEKIVIGTYNNAVKGKKANPAFIGFSEGSSGIYFCKLKEGNQEFINFYNFSEFKNFYTFISERNATRLYKKAKRKELKGKELAFNYQLLVHDIIVKDSTFIMIAEAYYPEYHTITYTTFDANGRPITTSYTVFDGYRYTNTLIAAFNTKGELLWNNSFEIWNILTFNLKERVKVLIDGKDIVLAYNDGENIASKVISGNKVIEGKQYTKIESAYNNDKLLKDYNSDMEYWYGNYFISYGYQKIKNNQQNKTKRTVFYFNKIAFQ